MRLTDFPTEFERPSLPVTPSARRPSFWGEERDQEGRLPGAEGVPRQQDWDPVRKLEELQRRQEEVLSGGNITEPREIPKRDAVESAPLGEEREEERGEEREEGIEGRRKQGEGMGREKSVDVSDDDVVADTVSAGGDGDDVASPLSRGLDSAARLTENVASGKDGVASPKTMTMAS